MQVSAPLVPKIRSASDTSQFQEYEENEKIFRIATDCNHHAKEFAEFWINETRVHVDDSWPPMRNLHEVQL